MTLGISRSDAKFSLAESYNVDPIRWHMLSSSHIIDVHFDHSIKVVSASLLYCHITLSILYFLAIFCIFVF